MPTPRLPSNNFTGLYENWKPYILKLQLMSLRMPKFYRLALALEKHDHCYANFHDAYKASALLLANLTTAPFCSSLPIGRSTDTSCFELRSIQRWSDQLETMLQDCFDHAYWDMYRVVSENNIDTDAVTYFIRKCIGDVCTVTVNLPKPKIVDRLIADFA